MNDSYTLRPLHHLRTCAALVCLALFSGRAEAQQVPRPPAPLLPVAAPSPKSVNNAAKVIEDFARAWAGVSAYSARVTVFETNGSAVDKGLAAQDAVLDYGFRKPTSVTVRVLSGPNAGVTIQWDGGATVVARRGSGLAALFKKTLSLHDPLLTTARGSSIDQLGYGAILTHAREAGGTLSEAPADAINGVAAEAVTLIPSKADDVGLTREVVELSTITHLPMRILGFDGMTLVRRIDFTNVNVSG